MAYNRIAGIGKLTVNSGTVNNATVLQTMDNIVCFTSTITGATVSSGSALCKAPTTISAPSKLVYFIAYYAQGGQRYAGFFGYNTNRNIISYQALSNANVYLDGVCINLNNTFYNDTIGNNVQGNMSYPIGRA